MSHMSEFVCSVYICVYWKIVISEVWFRLNFRKIPQTPWHEHVKRVHVYRLNPSGDEAEVFRDKLLNVLTPDALTHPLACRGIVSHGIEHTGWTGPCIPWVEEGFQQLRNISIGIWGILVSLRLSVRPACCVRSLARCLSHGLYSYVAQVRSMRG